MAKLISAVLIAVVIGAGAHTGRSLNPVRRQVQDAARLPEYLVYYDNIHWHIKAPISGST